MFQRSAFATVVLVSALGCGGSDNSPSPTNPSPTTTLDLTGTWRGTIQMGTLPGSDVFFQWTAARSGDANFTGEARVAGPVFGTLGGTLSGTQLTATLSFPAGAFATASMCAVTGNGTLVASATTVSGLIVGMWPVALCPGFFVGNLPMTVVQNHQVSLSKVASP